MRNRFFATTAVAALIAVGAHAQATPETTPAAPTGSDAPAVAPAAPGTMTSEPAAPVLTPVLAGDLSADKLIGARIETMAGENIASVEDVVLNPDGRVESIAAEFGGFLGFGSNTVLLNLDEVSIMQDSGGAYVVQTALTPEGLEGRPAYEKAN